MKINYDNIDPKVRRTVEAIESKPHVKYIRYLLTKRFSPSSIKKELRKMGLSSSHEQHLVAYYLTIIDPVIKHCGLSYLYADYKSKLMSKVKTNGYTKDVMNYRLHLDGDLDGQVKFSKFIKVLELEDLWIGEIYRYHGSAAAMPTDEQGNRILNSTTSYRNHDKILLSDKRYLIDKLILENVPDNRIAKMCKEQLKLGVNDYDIASYKRVFFNVKTQSIEDKIKSIEGEKNSLELLLKDLNNDSMEFSDLTMGDKTTLVMRTEQRIKELDDNIKTLNSMYSEFACKVAQYNKDDFEGMFADIAISAYVRYKQLDAYTDRDVVDPLIKVVKMMGYAHDKMTEIKLTGGGNKSGDIHSKAVTMDLYKQRLEEVNDEVKKRAAVELGDDSFGVDISADDIDGIEELGLSFDEE